MNESARRPLATAQPMAHASAGADVDMAPHRTGNAEGAVRLHGDRLVCPHDGDFAPVMRAKTLHGAQVTACAAGQTSNQAAPSRWRSTACHSAGVTGVIDNRLPGRSSIMLARSGASRIAFNGSRRVLRLKRTSTSDQRGLSRLDFGSTEGLEGSNWLGSG